MYSKEHSQNRGIEFTLKYFLQKAQKYCSTQERSVFQTEKKLKEWGASPETATQVIQLLCKDGFIDSDRFIELFIRSKLRQNKWGRVKIGAELLKQKFSREQVFLHLEKIDETEYRRILSDLILKKKAVLKNEKDLQTSKQKIVYFCMSKGFEYDLIYSLL